MDSGGNGNVSILLTGQTFEGDNYYALLTLDYNKIADSPSKTIALQLADYYHAHWFQERYDPLTYYRALGLFRQAAEDVGANDFRPIVVSCGERRNALFGGNFDEQNGNELSYYQAMLIVDYLVEQQGLDAVLKSFLRMKTSPVALASHIKRLYRRPRLLLNRSGSCKKELS